MEGIIEKANLQAIKVRIPLNTTGIKEGMTIERNFKGSAIPHETLTDICELLP